jgi:hypothetical protein
MITARFSEQHAIAATIDPQALNDASATSDWVDMATYNRVTFIVSIGDTDATVDAKLQSGTTSAGGTTADIPDKAIAQLTATDDDSQVVLEISADEMPTDTGYCAVVVTGGAGTSGALVSAVGIGTVARNEPVTHLASVAEVVS